MPFKSEKQRRWMHANNPKMAKKWAKEKKMKKETKVRGLIRKMVQELLDEQLGEGEFRSHVNLDDMPDTPDEVGNQIIREKVEQEKHRRDGKTFEEEEISPITSPSNLTFPDVLRFPLREVPSPIILFDPFEFN